MFLMSMSSLSPVKLLLLHQAQIEIVNLAVMTSCKSNLMLQTPAAVTHQYVGAYLEIFYSVI
jgi:hypothetical protein